MVEVKMVKRKSHVLSPSGLDCLAHIPTVNVSNGCAHGCLYCYTRGYSIYPGEEKIEVYENLLEKLKKELPRKKRRPRAVYFSPSSDVFQPVPEMKKSGPRGAYIVDQQDFFFFLKPAEDVTPGVSLWEILIVVIFAGLDVLDSPDMPAE